MKKLLLLPIIACALTSCAPTSAISSVSGLSMMSLEACEAKKLTEDGKANFIREIKEELAK